jgi:hypothetical protein
LLGQSPVTRAALQKSAEQHNEENTARRSPGGLAGGGESS